MKHMITALILLTSTQLALANDTEIKNPLSDKGSWNDLKIDVVGDKPLINGNSLFNVEAPYRAHDAATVPLVIKKTDLEASPITSATVVIDENPAPVAAEFKFGKDMAPLDFELRVRVNSYSNVRVIAENGSGTFMNGRFVKASGGCSAPATKDPELALKNMGQMRLKHFGNLEAASNVRREAQIMIRHPNYSGLQRDPITHLFINAHFIDTVEVYQGEDKLFSLEGGISISENPVFRFKYTDNGSPSLRIRAEDTEGNVWEETLDKQLGS